MMTTGVIIHNDKLTLYFSNIISAMLVYYWKDWGK
jgi:hypothetical protein